MGHETKIFLPEYLKARGTATVLTYFECKVFGIPYPLEQGWLRKYRGLEITSSMRDALWTHVEGKDTRPVNRTREALMTLNAILAKPEHMAQCHSTSAKDSASKNPTRLNVSFSEKDEAKGLGARWDPRGRFWYVPEGHLITPFERWLPDGSTYHQLSGSGQTDSSAMQPRRKPTTAELFGSADLIVGKTIIGPNYFDTGHDCVPWLPCEHCTAAVKLHADQKQSS